MRHGIVRSFRNIRCLALAACISAVTLVPAPVFALTISCQAFMAHLQKSTPDLSPQFIRPVVVTRGSVAPGAEVRDLITKLRIDGQLFCNGDRFVRFEAKIHAPYNAALQRGYERIQVVAAAFKMQWPEARALRQVRSLHAQAADRIRASIQRGDVFVSGKVELHAGQAGDVGVVWTRSDRAFILVEYRP